MKKRITFFILVMLISFVSCDTVSRYTIRVSVDRLPVLTIVNQTGYTVVVTAPVATNLNNGGRTLFQPKVETNQSINVVYSIGQVEFTEQATINNADATVTLTKRPPTITVVNQTGYQVSLIAPERISITNGANYRFLTPGMNQIIDVTYMIGRMTRTEQVTINNADVTVTLTRKPPTLTVVNNVGATINTIFLRVPGSPTWTGGNIVIRNGIVDLAAPGGALATDISGSIVNRDSMQIWMGNIPLSGDRFDIRIDDVQGNTYVKNNVQIINDLALTFTTSDRR
jgi:hypothetical protein